MIDFNKRRGFILGSGCDFKPSYLPFQQEVQPEKTARPAEGIPSKALAVIAWHSGSIHCSRKKASPILAAYQTLDYHWYSIHAYILWGLFQSVSGGNRQLRQRKSFHQTLANPMFVFCGTCCPTLVRRTLMCDILKFVPGVCSPVTLHSVAAALKHLRFALRCWSVLTFIGQFWHFHAPTIRAPIPPSFLESRHNKPTV